MAGTQEGYGYLHVKWLPDGTSVWLHREDDKRGGGRHAKHFTAIGVRWCFELMDNYFGQFAAVLFPRKYQPSICDPSPILKHTRFATGLIR